MRPPSLFPTTVVGSLPRPQWVMALFAREITGQVDPETFQSRLDSAVLYAIQFQEMAGVDILFAALPAGPSGRPVGHGIRPAQAGSLEVLEAFPEHLELGLGCVDVRAEEIPPPGRIVEMVHQAARRLREE